MAGVYDEHIQYKRIACATDNGTFRHYAYFLEGCCDAIADGDHECKACDSGGGQ